ncbi:blood stage antigen 41-3 precursor [Cystoisospora suis]|uniref:Blood stage antigen 41-3 n=1 Tax=Cystoisospora suis TaxID=483139 RepID=A0A2C6LD13_9APIC|nr:blood stage antigen 41-3 precursor [Cystoisospora suis]
MLGNASHPGFVHNIQPLPQVTAEIQLLERARMRLEELFQSRINAYQDSAQRRQGPQEWTCRSRAPCVHILPGDRADDFVCLRKQVPRPAWNGGATTDEIEELRTDEETRMFQQAIAEFEQLTKITVQGTPTCHHPSPVQEQLSTTAPASRTVAFREVDEEGTPFLGRVRETRGQLCLGFHQINGLLRNARSCGTDTPISKWNARRAGTQSRRPGGSEHPTFFRQPGTQSSFLEVTETAVSTQSTESAQLIKVPTFQEKGVVESKLFDSDMEKQLNVKVAQSDKPYPTVDELVSDMEKKRNATERLERMKILELQLKLLKAQDEMIKDALHTSVARVLAQYAPAGERVTLSGTTSAPHSIGPSVEAVKAEVAIRSIA